MTLVLTMRILVGAVGVVILTLLALRRRASGDLGIEVEQRVPDTVVEVLRNLLIGPAAIGVIAWLIHPAWMAWSSIGLPVWARWGGAALLVLATVGVWSAFGALGRNFATTLVIQRDHELVTSGPYRYVRHPMYTLGAAMFVGLMLVTDSWFIGALGASGMLLLMIARTPREEAMLATRFGDAWVEYVRHTGRLLPRWPGVPRNPR